MSAQPPSVRAIFDHALDILSEPERRAYIESACESAPDSREKVEALLRAYSNAGNFLEAPPAAVASAGDEAVRPISEGPGTKIGPYKLLQQIGEGGFGVVYMAEQQTPVRRKIALKIIKPGMDTKEVIARFESERQALALMDHPNIAKVLDAGATESSRPYFVMELVKGIPITQFCDDNHLPPEERLELFIQVCNALQHAHQKGIIHRDLKPSNVMVTMRDGHPVPKVIDFGVAKATSQTLTERTLFTAYGQMIGTPAYMSPEQAEMSCLDIDTRSDIYSLGVLLYELLTGTTPFDSRRLREAGFAEMQRIIRDEDPPKPSTRVSTLQGPALTSLSQQHGIDERRLRQHLHGELDWIVMKSLEKDREQRYESAVDLARDVRRYLADEPVQACPPSAIYRFQKFSKKHSAALTTLSIVVVTLVIAVTISLWQAIRATRAEKLATANAARALNQEQQARSEQQKAIAAAQAARTAQEAEAAERRRAESQAQLIQDQRNAEVARATASWELLDRLLKMFSDEPENLAGRQKLLPIALDGVGLLEPKNQVQAFHRIGNMFVVVDEFPSAFCAYNEALAIEPRNCRVLISRGETYFRQGDYELALADQSSAIEYGGINDPVNRDFCVHVRRGFTYCRLEKFDEALADFRTAYGAYPLLTMKRIQRGFGSYVESQVAAGAIIPDRLVNVARWGAVVPTAFAAKQIESGIAQLTEQFIEEHGDSAWNLDIQSGILLAFRHRDN